MSAGFNPSSCMEKARQRRAEGATLKELASSYNVAIARLAKRD